MLEFTRCDLLRSAVALAIAATAPLLPTEARAQPATPPVIFAAASLKTALDAIAADWRIQHRVGVEGADLIVAINTDKNAPIFDFAHVGIVTDAIRLLPALTEAFRKRLSPHTRDRIAS
jgi:ABC-type molybdate transport system substrate-binding protein